jgi:hypothetical protein
LYFYLSFSKELIKNQEESKEEGSHGVSIEILRKALKNVRDEDIEIFLHYSPEVAI